MNENIVTAIERLQELKVVFEAAAKKKPPSNCFLRWLHHQDTPQEIYSPYAELAAAAINRLHRNELKYADVVLNGLHQRISHNADKFSRAARKFPRNLIGIDKKKAGQFTQHATEMENIIKTLGFRLGIKLRSQRFDDPA